MAVRIDPTPALIKACVKKTKRYVRNGCEYMGFCLERNLVPKGVSHWEVALAHVEDPEKWEHHQIIHSTTMRFAPAIPGVVELPGPDVFVFIRRRILRLV